MKLSEQLKRAGFIQVTENKHDESVEMDNEAFMKFYLEHESDFMGIHWENRIKFLEDNGYEVTHANLINHNLPARQS